MTRKKKIDQTKPIEEAEEQTIEVEPSVMLEEPVLPESPAEEPTKTDEKLITETETSEVQTVVEAVAEGMVTAKAIVRNISFIDPVDGDIKRIKKDEVFTTTKERMDSLDQRFIEIL